jgi:hypothetical protein
MNPLRQAAQQALEALEKTHTQPGCEQWQAERKASVALRAALAQQEQEPVAFADRISFDQAMKSGKGHDVWPEAGDYEARTGRKLRVLYTHPPRREWQSLTDEEIATITKEGARGSAIRRDGTTSHRIARAIEAALKEKNNG